MADGKGCKCAARSESECGCDADWTPQEVYDLRTENKQLKEAIRRLADQDATLSVQGGNVIVEMDATLTDAERTVLEVCANHWLTAPAHGVLCGLLKRMR